MTSILLNVEGDVNGELSTSVGGVSINLDGAGADEREQVWVGFDEEKDKDLFIDQILSVFNTSAHATLSLISTEGEDGSVIVDATSLRKFSKRVFDSRKHSVTGYTRSMSTTYELGIKDAGHSGVRIR